MSIAFEMGSTLKGKNLLQEEQIISFKSWPVLRCEAKYSSEHLNIHVNTVY